MPDMEGGGSSGPRWARGGVDILDPAVATDVPSGRAVAYVFDGLTRFTPEARLEPALAERWEVSPDGKVYTFHLRRGVRAETPRRVVRHELPPDLAAAFGGTPVVDHYLDQLLNVRRFADASLDHRRKGLQQFFQFLQVRVGVFSVYVGFLLTGTRLLRVGALRFGSCHFSRILQWLPGRSPPSGGKSGKRLS